MCSCFPRFRFFHVLRIQLYRSVRFVLLPVMMKSQRCDLFSSVEFVTNLSITLIRSNLEKKGTLFSKWSLALSFDCSEKILVRPSIIKMITHWSMTNFNQSNWKSVLISRIFEAIRNFFCSYNENPNISKTTLLCICDTALVFCSLRICSVHRCLFFEDLLFFVCLLFFSCYTLELLINQ